MHFICMYIGLPQKMWVRLQAILFPLLTTLLVALGWHFFLHPRHVLRKKEMTEGITLIMRYVLWTAFITSKFGLAESTAV